MTYNPTTLQALVKYWTAQGGVNLGVVGDTAHVNGGVSYHLGKDHLQQGAYSISTARDRLGLTNAASAMDLGKLDGTLAALRLFSTWLVDEARHNKPGTFDMREIIWSPDGATVLRWDRERGYDSEPRPGEADDSHLTHTHVSWYRDAEPRDHTTAFRPYFTPQPNVLHIAKGAEVRSWPGAGHFSGCLDTREASTRTWDNPASSVGCTRPRRRTVCRSTARTTVVYVTVGTFAGRLVRVSRKDGVTVT